MLIVQGWAVYMGLLQIINSAGFNKNLKKIMTSCWGIFSKR